MNALPVTSAPVELARGFTVEFTFDGSALHCEWAPGVPHGRHGRKLIPAYQQARDAFLRTVSERIGVNIAVVDVPADGGAHG